jgi:hypothetical protein
MKKRIEELIRQTEQLHAECIVAGISLADSIEDVLDDLYWVYKEATEFDE